MASDPSPYRAPDTVVSGAEPPERSLAARILGVVGKGYQQAEQNRMYEEQLRRSSELLTESERQQKRMADAIMKQEEQARRLDAVLDRLAIDGDEAFNRAPWQQWLRSCTTSARSPSLRRCRSSSS